MHVGINFRMEDAKYFLVESSPIFYPLIQNFVIVSTT